MEGIKCPVCMAIRLTEEAKDGEMVQCSYCKAKFTVTRLRRYSVFAKGGKLFADINEEKKMAEFVHNLDNERLVVLVKLVTGELVDRYRKNEGYQLESS